VSDLHVIESVTSVLSDLLTSLKVPFSRVEVIEEEGGMFRANIVTDRAPYLIGTYGERIDAIQHLLKNILWKQGFGETLFVIVDIDNYKKSREEKILSLAEEKIQAAQQTGIPQTMPYLDPYLRKIVHTHISHKRFAGITTQSVGEGRDRRLKIYAGGYSSL
jgi:spoIIIJ-associated protein